MLSTACVVDCLPLCCWVLFAANRRHGPPTLCCHRLQVSTGAVDDIRRATELAHKAVSEFGLNRSVGPLSVNTIAMGGDDNPFAIKGGGACRCLKRNTCCKRGPMVKAV